jgi:hypothetical protein
MCLGPACGPGPNAYTPPRLATFKENQDIQAWPRITSR